MTITKKEEMSSFRDMIRKSRCESRDLTLFMRGLFGAARGWDDET